MPKVKLARVRDILANPRNSTLLLFGIEGFLFQFVMSMSGSGGLGASMFATNLGATDSQISLTHLIPNLAAVLLLLPMGAIADRTKNAKTVPMALMIAMGFMYILLGSVPMMGQYRIPAFFMLMPFTAGFLAIYNAIWQAFFGDVTPIYDRNRVYAFRNRFVFGISIVLPVIFGVLLTAQDNAEDKLTVLQVFFYLCAAVNFLNAFVLSRIPGGQRSPEALAQMPKFSVKNIGRVLNETAHNRKFMRYFIPSMLVFMTWHMDWSMWYISQVQYLQMSETEISVYSAIIGMVQLVTTGVFVKSVDKRGAQRTLMFSLLTLSAFPVIMLTSSLAPAGWRGLSLMVLGFLIGGPLGATNLCLVQMLLEAAPEKNRSLVVSLNMVFVTLSNAVMPFLGVQIYNAFGADHHGFVMFHTLSLVLRSSVAVVYLVKNHRERDSLKGLQA